MMKTEVHAEVVGNPVRGDGARRDTIPPTSTGENQNYGRLVYEIEEHIPKGKCDPITSQLRVRFYESIILFENTEQVTRFCSKL